MSGISGANFKLREFYLRHTKSSGSDTFSLSPRFTEIFFLQKLIEHHSYILRSMNPMRQKGALWYS